MKGYNTSNGYMLSLIHIFSMTGSITWNNKKQGVDQADFVCNRHPKFLSGFEI